MADLPSTQPVDTLPDAAGGLGPQFRCRHVGRSYRYLCQVRSMFIYSHVPFGKVVWTRHAEPRA